MQIETGLVFDDVLLVPQYSDIESRSDVDVSVKLNDLKLKYPVVPSNMKTIMGPEMISAILESGGLAVLHRFMPIEDQLAIAKDTIDKFGNERFAISVGVKSEDLFNVSKFMEIGVKIFCIDVAHGDSKQCIEMIVGIKKLNNNNFVIAGNVATGAGARRLWEAGADVVKVGIGPGCFAAGTKILMSNGQYKNIEEIKRGEWVINKDGNPVKVIDAFSTGVKKVSKLKTNLFYEDTYLTPDHQLWVGDLNTTTTSSYSSLGYAKSLDKMAKTKPRSSKYKWKEVGEMKRDVCLFPKNIKFQLPEKFEINLEKRVSGNQRTGPIRDVDSVITANYNSGYLFGTFLGDESALCTLSDGSHSGSVRWYFGKNETEIAAKLIKCIKEIFGKEAKLTEKENIIHILFYYKPLADFLHTWGKKKNKKLPPELLVNSKEYIQGLYDGLMDSDGHYNADGRKTFGNTSTNLIEIFNILSFLLFGIMPNNNKREPSAGGLLNCNVENCNPSYTSQNLKRGDFRLTKDYQVVKVLGYEELDLEMEVYDLTVDCETHSFIANNMIVHNSICTTRVETGSGVPQLTALVEASKVASELRENSYGQNNRSFSIMSDGGCKNAGDITKALCFADVVMAGNIFAGCEETPGDIVMINNKPFKEYVGSSTHKTTHIEGVSGKVLAKGSFKDILTNLLDGVRSGCSYSGARNLEELKQKAQFVRMTGAGLIESRHHDIIVGDIK